MGADAAVVRRRLLQGSFPNRFVSDEAKVFGQRETRAQRLLLKLRLRGPGWLELTDARAVPAAERASLAASELELDSEAGLALVEDRETLARLPTPVLSVLAIDALFGPGGAVAALAFVAGDKSHCDAGRPEAECLAAAARAVRELDPDVLLGHKLSTHLLPQLCVRFAAAGLREQARSLGRARRTRNPSRVLGRVICDTFVAAKVSMRKRRG